MSPRKVYTVTGITDEIGRRLEQGFGEVWVQGEISGLVKHGSGHWYFGLKDDRSYLRAVMFKFQNMYLRFSPEEGTEVLCRGKITAYPPRSTYQIRVEWMEPVGKGALYLEFEQLKKRLEQQGLFDPEKKKPLPSPIRRIAVISSVSGAALHDMLHVLSERDRNIEVLIIPSRVQGEGAAEELARAVETANLPAVAAPADRRPLEAVVLARGGGSIEDLWAFNQEVLARAIADSRLPVVSAIGHEVDFTIADFTADLRAPTPTAAAEIIAQGKPERTARLDHLLHRLRETMKKRLEEAETLVQHRQALLRDPLRRIMDYMIKTDELQARSERALRNRISRTGLELRRYEQVIKGHDPRRFYAVQSDRLQSLEKRLIRDVSHEVQNASQRLAARRERLQALSPRATLQRGYSIVRDRENNIIKSSGAVKPADSLEVILYKGRLGVQVEKIMKDEEEA
ncbi:MAG: exodeoxyribonuclease VII large subunit [bacterium]